MASNSKTGEVKVNIKTDSNNAKTSMLAYGAAVAAAVVVIKKLISVGTDLVKVYGEQEQAERKLAAAIKATGNAAAFNQTALQQLASDLQQVTIYGDEATLSAMAMLQQLSNLTQQGLMMVTPAVMDFAAAMSLDLETAASLVGKTLGSATNALTRYGVEIDMTVSPTEKLIQLTQKLNEKFGGMAKAMADTTLGEMAQFKNMWGDLKEIGGKAITEWLSPTVEILNLWGKKLIDLVTGTDDLATATANLGDVVGGGKQSAQARLFGDILLLTENANTVSEGVNSITYAFRMLAATGDDMSRAWAAQATNYAIDTFDSITDLAESGGLESAMTRIHAMRNALRDTVKVPPEQLQVLQEYIDKIWAAAAALGGDKSMLKSTVAVADAYSAYLVTLREGMIEAGLIIPMAEAYNATIETEIELLERLKDAMGEVWEMAKDDVWSGLGDVFEAFGASFADIEQGAEAGKEAIKSMVVAGLQALAKYLAALAVANFGLGMYGKAVATGAGAAAALAGAGYVSALGEGGIVTRPTMALIGERGPEAVVPLGRGGGMGNTTVVHIHAGMVATSMQVEQWVASIARRAR